MLRSICISKLSGAIQIYYYYYYLGPCKALGACLA